MATDKRNKTISIVVTEDLYKSLEGLADLEDITLSKYGFQVFENLVLSKKTELRLLAEALGVNI